MQVFPLIHSRTFEADFNSKFAVRPPDFGDAEIEWARSKILPATKNIGLFDGVRRVVAAKGGICIAGIVCTIKNYSDKIRNLTVFGCCDKLCRVKQEPALLTRRP